MTSEDIGIGLSDIVNEYQSIEKDLNDLTEQITELSKRGDDLVTRRKILQNKEVELKESAIKNGMSEEEYASIYDKYCLDLIQQNNII